MGVLELLFWAFAILLLLFLCLIVLAKYIARKKWKRLAKPLPAYEMGDSDVYLFAYGAMMNDSVWKRRKIEKSESAPAVVRDFELSFSIVGLWPVEPAFANMKPKEGALTHGVLHKLSPQDFYRLWLFERSYEAPVATAELYDGSTVECRIFSAPHAMAPGRSPSARYMNLVLEGAVQYGVDEQWLAHLRDIPTGGIAIPRAVYVFMEQILKRFL